MDEFHRLHSKIRAQKEKIDGQEAQNARLRTALLRALIAQKGESECTKEEIFLAMNADINEPDKSGSEEAHNSDDEDDGIQDDHWLSQDEDGDVNGLHKPIDDAGVPRCVNCTGEVIEGACHLCASEHVWDPKLYEESNATDSHAVDLDRSPVPRGDTPLGHVPKFKEPLEGYSKGEYTHLLKRGATRLMVETFSLEFTPQGIVAWADQDLFDEFSGPAMKEGHKWKIHLGRRIKLDEDDLDGSEFIEGLLEDALLFPVDFARWETVQETPGLWITRLKAEDAAKLQEPLEFESDVKEESEVEGEGEREGVGADEDGGDKDSSRPIMNLDYYQTADEESGDHEEFEDETLAIALDDPGWATRANVRDSSWSDADMDEDEGDEEEEETASGDSDVSMDDDSDVVGASGEPAGSNLMGLS